MKLINWIKQKLLLHVPLWICGFCAVMALSLLESKFFITFLSLFFAYFLARYLWCKHLRKTGKIGDVSRDRVFSLVFWVIIGKFWLPAPEDTPHLVIYEVPEPDVYDSIEYLSNTKAEGGDESDDTKLMDKEQKRIDRRLMPSPLDLITGLASVIERSISVVHDGSFACTFVQQHNFIDNCKPSPENIRRIELDYDASTVELLIMDKEAVDCTETACNVWLIQTTQAQINQFNDTSRNDEVVDKIPPIAEATLIDQWEDIITPLIIFNDVSNGWRHIQVTDMSGNVEVWKGQ